MLKNISFVSLSFLYINILGYIFHFYVSRHLGPAAYGEFMVLYSLMLTVGNISSILGTVTVKAVIENSPYEIETLRFLRKVAFSIGTIITVGGILFSLLIKNFLHLTRTSYIWIISLCWLVMFNVATERGFLQAKERFGKYAFSTSLELTVRLLTAVIFLYLGCQVKGVIASSLVGLCVTFGYLILINDHLKGALKCVSFKKMMMIALFISPASFFVYADTLFIRRIFDNYTAGIFSSISILGKALIWFSITIFSVFFPRLVKLKQTNLQAFKRLAFKALALTTFLYFGTEISLKLTGKFFFKLLFGQQFMAGYPYLATYILNTLPLTLNIICINIFTAIQKNLLLIYAHLLLYYALLLKFGPYFHNSLSHYIFCIGLFNTFFLSLYIIALLFSK